MIRAQQRASVRQLVSLTMAEKYPAFGFQFTAAFQVVQVSVERNLAQHNDNFHVGQRGEFAIEKCRAISNLFRRWFVLRRSAADSSRDIGIGKLEAVFAANGGRLGRKSRLMQDR